MKAVKLFAGAILAAGALLHAAEAHTASVVAPWQGEGSVYMSSPTTAKFMGVLKGVMFVQRGDKEQIDALPFVCPSVQEINLKNRTFVTNGNCMIGANNDIIYASYTCSGPVDGCEGKFNLQGGSGKFANISGGSDLSARVKASVFVLDSGAIIAQKASSGVLMLPNLTYKIPAK
jgi:hypothetical protein